MVSRKQLFSLLVLLISTSFLLVACERPTPGRDEADTGTTEVAPDAGTEGTVADTAVDEGSNEETAVDTEVDTPTDTQPAEETAADTAETTDETATNEADTTGTTGEGGEAETTDETADTETADTGGEGSGEATETEEETGERPSTHTVAAGENLYRIGLKYGISWVALADYNKLANAHKLQVGQVVNLPPNEEVDSTPTPTPSPATETTYTVKAGDNLFRIGLKYGISWIQIAEANGIMNANLIEVGDTLKIPVSAPGPSPQFTHRVSAGDTLFKISLQYGVPWPAIASENDVPAPYVIYVGQTLQVPGQ